jgi:hypothetical protein
MFLGVNKSILASGKRKMHRELSAHSIAAVKLEALSFASTYRPANELHLFFTMAVS